MQARDLQTGGSNRRFDEPRYLLGAAGTRSPKPASASRTASINVNSAAVRRPALIAECADAIGNQNVVLSMDIRQVAASPEMPSGYENVIDGGRRPMAMDALAWALKGERLGAGELVVHSIDADGTHEGYELKLTRMLSEAVRIPVIASGGAGEPEHLHDVLTEGNGAVRRLHGVRPHAIPARTRSQTPHVLVRGD